MAAEGWVAISKRISAVSGSKVINSRSTLGDTLLIDTSIWVCQCDVSFHIVQNKNSPGGEIANVNILQRYHIRTSKYQKEPTSFNKLDDS